MRQKLPIVIENTLTPEELRTWRRIKAEPESLLVNEVEENVLKSEKDGIDGITIYFDKQHKYDQTCYITYFVLLLVSMLNL